MFEHCVGRPFTRCMFFSLLLWAITIAQAAEPACDPIRFAYPDFNLPPFFLGKGSAIPVERGAAVDLFNEVAASRFCKVVLTRLPTKRALGYAMTGEQDAIVITEPSEEIASHLALPRNAANGLDYDEAVRINIYVYVIKRGLISHEVDPKAWLASRTIGVEFGSNYGERLRQFGFKIEQDSSGTESGLNKLLANRVDAIATAGASLDQYLALHPELNVIRLDKPIAQNRAFIAFSLTYYQANRESVEAMWAWFGKHGQERLDSLVRHYDSIQAEQMP